MRMFEGGTKPGKVSLLHSASLGEGNHLSHSKIKNSPTTPLRNQSLKSLGKGTKPCFPQRQIKVHS